MISPMGFTILWTSLCKNQMEKYQLYYYKKAIHMFKHRKRYRIMKCAFIPQRVTSKMHDRRTRCIRSWNYSRIARPWRATQGCYWNALAAQEQITQALRFMSTIPVLQVFTFTSADLDIPSPLVYIITLTKHSLCPGFTSHLRISTFWLPDLPSLLSPPSSESHAASVPSAPPLPCLPFHFPSSALLAADEKHYFPEAFTPGRPQSGFWQTLIRDDAAVAKPYKLFQE